MSLHRRAATQVPARRTGKDVDPQVWQRLELSLQDCLGVLDLSNSDLDDDDLVRVWEHYRRYEGCKTAARVAVPVWYVRLSYNRLRRFPAWLVEEVGETLRVLDLSHNGLCSPLDGLELARLPELEFLSLAHNQGIRALPLTVTKGLYRAHPLQLVDLGHTSLERIDALCSEHLSSIRVLKLEHCNIEELPASIAVWRELWSLDLRDNIRLAGLPHSATALAASLQKLSLEGCKCMETPPPIRIRRACAGKQGLLAFIAWLIDQGEITSRCETNANSSIPDEANLMVAHDV
jgi:Leucine-rich repeat (LRR) protein